MLISSSVGKERCVTVCVPQLTPKIHFKCIVITHLEHNNSTPWFVAKKTLNNSSHFFMKRNNFFLGDIDKIFQASLAEFVL